MTLEEALIKITPYNKTYGEPHVSITLQSATSGTINYLLDWKCFNREAEFSNLTELEKQIDWLYINYPIN